ncbi:MAG: DUF6580 family putative transport protein [Pseudomonadota bacterium]
MTTPPTQSSRLSQAWQVVKERPELWFILLLIVFARLVPHPWNVTPIGATAVFAGAWLNPRWSWAVALVPLAIGDLLIGGYNWVAMLFVYLGFAGTALAGYGWLGRRRTLARGAGAVVSGSLFFFLSSNFGVWAAGYYPPTWAGLVECYVKGLPYLSNTLAGDAVYTALFFGVFYAVRQATNRPAASA